MRLWERGGLRRPERAGRLAYRLAPVLAALVLLAAGGFAAASIASGGALSAMGTSWTVGTTGPWSITGPHPAKVPVCHRTQSKKHPSHTIVVSSRAVPAHLRHGDTLGPCDGGTPGTTTGTLGLTKHEGEDQEKHGAEDQEEHGGSADEHHGNSSGNGNHDHGHGGDDHGKGHGHP